MVKTGYISFVIGTGGGFDVGGNPIEETKTPTEYMPCNLAVITKEYRILVDGQYQQAAYKVVIDNSVICKVLGTINPRPYLSALIEIRLQDLAMNNLGTFQPQNKEFMDITNQFKIVA